MTQGSDKASYVTDSASLAGAYEAPKTTVQLESKKAQFRSVLEKYAPLPEETGQGAKISKKPDALSTYKLLEQMRVDTASMRLQLITGLLRKEKKETAQYDVQGKCMRIASKIIRGKKVTVEEMRFLLQNDPGLYFLALMMRLPDNEDEDDDEPPVDVGEESNAFTAAVGP